MSKYKEGDKVVTPLGVGVVECVVELPFNEVLVKIDDRIHAFLEEQVEYYKTAHERLLELGYELQEISNIKVYVLFDRHGGIEHVFKVNDTEKTILPLHDLNLEKAKIMVQYLEELKKEETK